MRKTSKVVMAALSLLLVIEQNGMVFANEDNQEQVEIENIDVEEVEEEIISDDEIIVEPDTEIENELIDDKNEHDELNPKVENNEDIKAADEVNTDVEEVKADTEIEKNSELKTESEVKDESDVVGKAEITPIIEEEVITEDQVKEVNWDDVSAQLTEDEYDFSEMPELAYVQGEKHLVVRVFEIDGKTVKVKANNKTFNGLQFRVKMVVV